MRTTSSHDKIAVCYLECTIWGNNVEIAASIMTNPTSATPEVDFLARRWRLGIEARASELHLVQAASSKQPGFFRFKCLTKDKLAIRLVDLALRFDLHGGA